MKVFIPCLFIFQFFILNAQDVPAPAKPQSERICLKGATVHVGNGRLVENAYLVFEGGKITELFSAQTVKTDVTLGKVIDLSGKHIYPGLIALNTVLGLSEIEAVRSTNDVNETGNYNPNARAITSYNTDSRVTPTVRSNGVLYAQIIPHGGSVSGTSSIVQLDAWNWEDAALKRNDGICVHWPSMYKFKGWGTDQQGFEPNKDYDKQVDDLKQFFTDAMSYTYSKVAKSNLRFEAMKDVFLKKQNVYVFVDYVREIKHVIRFAKELDIHLVLVGARDAYMMAPELAENKVPVILNKTHELPSYDDEDIQQPYKTPAMLQNAGVLFAIANEGFWQSRNLAFQAGTAVAYGLDKEQALSAITQNAAKIVGLESKIGSVEVGKDASFIVSEGDLLDMKSSQIKMAFIEGREINLDNKQTELYRKFSEKYFGK